MNKILGAIFAVFAPLAAMLVLGCGPTAASNRSTIPGENVTQCVSLCESAGLALQSLVIVANQTGCVCSPLTAQAQSNVGGTAAASGGAVAVLIAQQQRQQQR